MLVILKRRLFVGGNRYRSIGKSPVEIPDKYRKQLPKDAVVVGELKVGEPKILVEDGPDKILVSGISTDKVPVEDDGDKPYVNPAHDLDSDRAFAEAFANVTDEAKSEVESLREHLKNTDK